MRQPAVDQMVSEPSTPPPLEDYAEIDLHDAQQHAYRQDGEIEERQSAYGCGIAILKAIEIARFHAFMA